MTYSVKEIYYTLQGEGAQAGRAAVFLRFAGCNLWTGREEDRHKAVCKFCDTQFVGMDGENGGRYTAKDLADVVFVQWREASENRRDRYVVCTGGEPLLQLDQELVDELHESGFEVAVETNGTKKVTIDLDWICVSPKADSVIEQTWGNELKLVYPQDENDPRNFLWMNFDHFFLQPKDDANAVENTQAAIRYCLENPKWRLSLQTHKILNLK